MQCALSSFLYFSPLAGPCNGSRVLNGLADFPRTALHSLHLDPPLQTIHISRSTLVRCRPNACTSLSTSTWQN